MRPPFFMVAPRGVFIGGRAVASRPPPYAPLLGGVFHSIGLRRSSVAVAMNPPFLVPRGGHDGHGYLSVCRLSKVFNHFPFVEKMLLYVDFICKINLFCLTL